MTTVDDFLQRITAAGWHVTRRPSGSLTPRIGDIATCQGDPTAYHVSMVGTKVTRLDSDAPAITLYIPTDDVQVAARLDNGAWRDVRREGTNP